MIRLLFLMLMMPLMACSQQDLGFWEGTPEKLGGCKMWRVVTENTSPLPIAFRLMIVDCYGNQKESNTITSNGGTYYVCSMEEPTGTESLIQSIASDGWCTDPPGSTWDFWVSALRADGVSPFPGLVSEIKIYSWNGGQSAQSLIYETTNPQSIEGESNAVTINDTHPSDSYYVVEITARRDPSKSYLITSISPGQGLKASFLSASFETKTLILTKREFYITVIQSG